ncbi:dCTP deaminase [Parasutterella excrementihominis]|jgi:dCTP deaminase|uniref:dCTP deaminase n=1 Tax=Parasutterella excrementihominis TaxID=487175 RepID=UPI003AB49737
MAVLNDSGILKAIRDKQLSVLPLPADRIQPASIDLSLGDSYTLHSPDTRELDFSSVSKESLSQLENTRKIPQDGFLLKPGELAVCHTAETLIFSTQIYGQIFNRSSLVRWGIDAAKANFINPGFKGKMPLVIHNFGSIPFRLKEGQIICQLQVCLLETPTLHSYENRHDPKELGSFAKEAGFSTNSQASRADDPLSKFLHERISEITIGR